MVGMVSDLNVQAGCLSHELDVIGLHFQGILEAFCSFSEVLG